MPRPSLKAQRSEEILDAFERCVALYGVQGATLERTAEEVGLQRSLIRHNVGNRDDLLDTFVERYIEKSELDLEELSNAVIEVDKKDALIEILFDEKFSDNQSVLVAQALIVAAPHYPSLSPKLQKWVESTNNTIEKILRKLIPNAKSSDHKEVAAGIVGIYFNVESLSPIGTMNAFRKNSKKAAMRLINTLVNN